MSEDSNGDELTFMSGHHVSSIHPIIERDESQVILKLTYDDFIKLLGVYNANIKNKERAYLRGKAKSDAKKKEKDELLSLNKSKSEENKQSKFEKFQKIPFAKKCEV